MVGAQTVIVDYGTGNLFNVQRACVQVGLSAIISNDPEKVRCANAVILPGVGAMPVAMRALKALGLDLALREAVVRGSPLLGICLGMQLLMEEGSEFESHRGLGILPGRVVPFPKVTGGVRSRVPHIGWNAIEPFDHNPNGWSDGVLAGLPAGELMYFLHSYYVVPSRAEHWLGLTKYDSLEFCSAVAAENIMGCQFHPERSGPAGLRIYERFARLLHS